MTQAIRRCSQLKVRGSWSQSPSSPPAYIQTAMQPTGRITVVGSGMASPMGTEGYQGYDADPDWLSADMRLDNSYQVDGTPPSSPSATTRTLPHNHKSGGVSSPTVPQALKELHQGECFQQA
jgi:hypothetical protein